MCGTILQTKQRNYICRIEARLFKSSAGRAPGPVNRGKGEAAEGTLPVGRLPGRPDKIRVTVAADAAECCLLLSDIGGDTLSLSL